MKSEAEFPPDLRYGQDGTSCCGLLAYIEPCAHCPANCAPPSAVSVEAAAAELANWRKSEYYTDDKPVFLRRKWGEAILALAKGRLDAALVEG